MMFKRKVKNPIDLPFKYALGRCGQLCKTYYFSWLICLFIGVSFCFFICPQQLKIEEKLAQIERKNKEITHHETMIKRKEEAIKLIEEHEPKTMERLVRDAFDVKAENETGIHSPPFNIPK